MTANSHEPLITLVRRELQSAVRQQITGTGRGSALDVPTLMQAVHGRLAGHAPAQWTDKGRYLAVASLAMRQLFVDQARARLNRTRGSLQGRITPEATKLDVEHQAETLLGLEELLVQSDKGVTRITDVVTCRFFGGLTEGETAEALGMELSGVRRDWAKGKMLLRRAAAGSGDTPPAAIQPDDWDRIEPALDALLDAPPDRRAKLLAGLSGGDEALSSRLEQLVAECERGWPLLERPAAEQFSTLCRNELDFERVASSLSDRYRLTRELGHGGMAVVYLAHDIKHGRGVAVKIVHPELAATLGRERFLREIEIAARLHHPHIVPVYDSGDADGVLYYVMPYESGPSLRERLSREGPLPVPDAIAVLTDVCDALAYAHEQGVVHRDIKPDNILLAGRHALVTDFGVARAVSTAGSEASITAAGVTLGTPAYMAPEQILADPNVDHRADIYAFGALAYEMLTGHPPFVAAAPPQVLSAHLSQAPTPVTKLRPELPEALNELVMKCLAKEPAARWQRTDDVLAQLEALGVERRSNGRRRLGLAVAGGVIVAAAAAAWLFLEGNGSAGLAIERAAPFTTDAGLEVYPALSPDGKLVAYSAGSSANMRVLVRPVGGGRTWSVSNDTSAAETHPRWSPNGERILFLSRGAAVVAPSFGGAPRQVAARSPSAPVRAAAWSPDGSEIAIVRGDSILVVSADGSASRFVAQAVDWHSCAWSPAGTWLACVEGNPTYTQAGAFFGNLGPSTIVLVNMSTGQRIAITDSAQTATNQSPQWSAGGARLLFVSDRDGPRDIYAIAISRDGQPRGTPRRLTTGLYVHSFSLDSADGRLTYAIYQEKANLWSIPIPTRPPVGIDSAVPVTSGSQVVEIMRVSDDGAWIYYDSNLHGNSDIFRLRLPNGEPERLTTSPSAEFAAAASPSGTEFAFHRFRGDQRDVFVQRLGGEAQQVTATRAQECCPVWSPDGNALAIAHFSSEGGIFVMRRESSGRWGAPVRRLPRGFLHSWSPDGKQIVVASGRAIRGTNHAERLELVSPDSGDPVTIYAVQDTINDPAVGDPHWDAAGTGIYFKSHDALGRASFWHVSATGGRPRLLVRFDDLARPSFRTNFTTDGKRFYFTINARESDVWLAQLTSR